MNDTEFEAREAAVPVLAGAEPFRHDGSTEIGVLLCHGFTGSPQSMRPWGMHLAAQDFTVRGPLLPGHGTSWQQLNKTRWTDWYGALETAFAELADRCASVFVFGLSMGGTLTLRLAETHGDAIAGLCVVNPSLTTLRRDAKFLRIAAPFVGKVAGVGSDIKKPGVAEVVYGCTPLRAAVSLSELWAVTRAGLPSIHQPLLLFRSEVDHVVEPVSSAIVLDGVRSPDRTEIVLRDSYHVATLDNDAPRIFADSVEFARRVHTERVGVTG